MAYVLQKWDIIRVFRQDLRRPHNKFCICICPKRNWFLYLNSDPPRAPKRRQFAISIPNFQLLGLPKDQSWIDTTTMIDDLPSDQLAVSLADPNCQFGPLLPILRGKIRVEVNAHGVFTQEQTDAVLID
jgi:hypothetical protein